MAPALCYCGNVHPAKDLSGLLQSLAEGPARVRQALDQERLAYGLWLSADTLAESKAEDHRRLRAALDAHQLDVWTLNAFPLGDFHAPVVKHQVYQPHWGQERRLQYTLDAAELLATIMPSSAALGTISTLPIGYGKDFEDPAALEAAHANLRRAARGLADLADRSGKSIRLCLEPEPACVLETGDDAIAAFSALLDRDTELVEAHLGLCLDTCHHAVAFEDPKQLLFALLDAGIAIGKVQLSNAAALSPGNADAMAVLRSLDEPRFLHQVRTRDREGKLHGCDDLCDTAALPPSEEWRVHYHLPIHQREYQALGTTQTFLVELLALLPQSSYDMHFEVETYTWGVLPEATRPKGAAQLASCIADELRFAREHLV